MPDAPYQVIRAVKATSCGWLRRPELDQGVGKYAWEKPCGAIVLGAGQFNLMIIRRVMRHG